MGEEYREVEMIIHFDYTPVKECKHPEWTCGEICIKCGECGRYDLDFKCTNCGYTEGKKPVSSYANWGSVEFYDVFSASICPKCRRFFASEDRMNFPDEIAKYGFAISHKIIPQKIAKFVRRK